MPESALPRDYRRQTHDSLPSTNASAFAAARDGESSGLWVTAGMQTEGRGRRGRAWVTQRGNLAASLLLIDPSPAAVAPTISFVAGVALHQAVIDLAGPMAVERLKLKWPNDLLVDRLKVAGVSVDGDKLADGRFAVVVGWGVNCVSHPEAGVVHPAGDLAGCGIPLDAESLFGRLAARMADEIVRWDRGSGFGAIRSAWLTRSAGIGEAIRVNLPGRSVDGQFQELDALGRLVLARPDGTRETFSAGDVFFPRGEGQPVGRIS
jgi:BirA family biotin operon repressor/biotin-[acetyl-CoA-carboxylase] ligase